MTQSEMGLGRHSWGTGPDRGPDRHFVGEGFTLFVGDLDTPQPAACDIDELIRPYAAHGRVLDVWVPFFWERPGWACVTLEHWRDAQEAVANLNGKTWKGSTLSVEYASGRRPRSVVEAYFAAAAPPPEALAQQAPPPEALGPGRGEGGEAEREGGEAEREGGEAEREGGEAERESGEGSEAGGRAAVCHDCHERLSPKEIADGRDTRWCPGCMAQPLCDNCVDPHWDLPKCPRPREVSRSPRGREVTWLRVYDELPARARKLMAAWSQEVKPILEDLRRTTQDESCTCVRALAVSLEIDRVDGCDVHMRSVQGLTRDDSGRLRPPVADGEWHPIIQEKLVAIQEAFGDRHQTGGRWDSASAAASSGNRAGAPA
jgi:hypothetical protein